MPHHQLCIQYAVSDGADENSYDGLRAGRLGVYDLATRRSLRIPVPIQAIPPSFQAAGRVITLPAARRTDAAPYGFAVDAIGLLRPVAVTVAGNVATLGAAAGAVSYQVLYYPLLTVRAPQGPRVQYDAAGAAASWEIVFEE